jgi:hypothetical protein
MLFDSRRDKFNNFINFTNRFSDIVNSLHRITRCLVNTRNLQLSLWFMLDSTSYAEVKYILTAF